MTGQLSRRNEGQPSLAKVPQDARAPVMPDVELIPVTDERLVRSVGLVTILIAIGLFGGWSLTAELDSVVVAPGIVTVESHRKTVQHLEGGIVKEIMVRDGDMVEAGELLLLLDDTKAVAELEVVRARYIAAIARSARMTAEKQGETHARFPDELLAMVGERVADEAMLIQQQHLEARRATFEAEVAILDQRIDQLKAKAEGLESLQRGKEILHRSYLEEAVELRRLLKEGMVDKMRLRQLERSAAEADSEAGEYKASIVGTRLQINETRQQILRLSRERLVQVTDELEKVQTELFDLHERLNVLADSVARTRITSPVAGEVLGLTVHTVGAVLQPGTRILDIVPRGEPMVVEARVPPAAIDKVNVGVAADIRFTAFSARTTPVVEGRVQRVSGDHISDGTGPAYYLIRVVAQLEDGSGGGPGEPIVLLPGMPAEVVLKTGKRTLFSYLAQPIGDAFARSFTED